MLSNSVFSRTGERLFLLAADATLLNLSRAARATLDGGLILRLRHGRLACVAATATTRLRRAVRTLGPGRTTALALPQSEDPRPGLATLSALSLPASGAGPAAPTILLHLMVPERRLTLRIVKLRLLFALTAAEARVALALLEADGLEELSRQLGIAVTTVRTHLHRVFAKTGTQRQSQLVRLLLSYGPPFPGGDT